MANTGEQTNLDNVPRQQGDVPVTSQEQGQPDAATKSAQQQSSAVDHPEQQNNITNVEHQQTSDGPDMDPPAPVPGQLETDVLETICQ